VACSLTLSSSLGGREVPQPASDFDHDWELGLGRVLPLGPSCLPSSPFPLALFSWFVRLHLPISGSGSACCYCISSSSAAERILFASNWVMPNENQISRNRAGNVGWVLLGRTCPCLRFSFHFELSLPLLVWHYISPIQDLFTPFCSSGFGISMALVLLTSKLLNG